MNKFVLHKTASRHVPGRTVPASSVPIVLWRQLRLWWERFRRMSQRTPRRLRLCESLPLGERRFVAVVEFERARFLVGGTSSSLVLLAQLGKNPAQACEGRSDDPSEVRNQDPEKTEKQPADVAAPDSPARALSGSVHP